ncbi:transketolase II [Atlantibacter hermannii]|nr:transketolase II [Atlantibacter hermannii]
MKVCSLAGTLGLGKLIGFTITTASLSTAKPKAGLAMIPRSALKAYHWHVIPDIDGHNPDAVKKAIEEAKAVTDKPSLIMCRTIIGFGSPNKAGKGRVSRRGTGRRGSGAGA